MVESNQLLSNIGTTIKINTNRASEKIHNGKKGEERSVYGGESLKAQVSVPANGAGM
jgi:hypothetical protein